MVQPNVGILASDRLQQHQLKTALMHFGFNVAISSDPERFIAQKHYELALDVWVVDVEQDDDGEMQWLDVLLERDTPVLMGVEKAPKRGGEGYRQWEKRLCSKVCELTVSSDVQELDNLNTDVHQSISAPSCLAGKDFSGQPARYVWVLGASLGGPSAVKEFIDALPGGLPIAFVYAQHIDPRFEKSLVKSVGRHSAYRFKNFVEGEALLCGEVLIAPMCHEFVINAAGQFQALDRPWPGPYTPSIDQVILNVAKHYGTQAQYIIFSGMGSDGAVAIAQLSEPQVWVQNSDSCGSASMPESVRDTGKVTYVGAPYQLALQLVEWVKQQWTTQYEPVS